MPKIGNDMKTDFQYSKDFYGMNSAMGCDVRMENETVLLSTGQMAILFDREESNIRIVRHCSGLHLRPRHIR